MYSRFTLAVYTPQCLENGLLISNIDGIRLEPLKASLHSGIFAKPIQTKKRVKDSRLQRGACALTVLKSVPIHLLGTVSAF